MTDLIDPPFTLFDIEVGPSLPQAQLQPGNTGIFVETLHTWLRFLAALSSNAVYEPDSPEPGAQAHYGVRTEAAVRAFRALVHLPDAAFVDTDTWNHLQTELTRPFFAVASRPLLPPNPAERRRPFPRRAAPDYPQQLRRGLQTFGFDFAEEETQKAARLFQCLVRGSRYYQSSALLGHEFEDEDFWSAQWHVYDKTWGRVLGAPWLGILATDFANIWGTRQTIRNLYDIGRNYLTAATSVDDLRHRLANPIRITRLAKRLGEPYGTHWEFPGREALFAFPDDQYLIRSWGEAISKGRAAVMRASPTIAPHIIAGPTYETGLQAVAVSDPSIESGGVPSIVATWVEYTFLQSIISLVSHSHSTWLDRYVIDLYLGTRAPKPWRTELPDKFFSIVNGAVTSHSAKATLIYRGFTLDDQRSTIPDGKLVLQPQTQHSNDIMKPLDTLGIRVVHVSLQDLQPDTEYSVPFHRVEDQEAKTWTTQTLPAHTSNSPFIFVAISCYSDYAIHHEGVSYTPPGHIYSASLANFQVEPFTRPRFKALLGDNIYLDYAPDWAMTLLPSLFRPEAEVIGRYLRYFACSSYTTGLESLPSFAIPDDHEYWNDFPNWQLHLQRAILSGLPLFDSLYARKAKAALRLFQSSMSPNPLLAGSSESDVDEFSYSVNINKSSTSTSLSMYFLDTTSTRTYDRSSRRLARNDIINTLLNWLSHLTGPGILFAGQPLFCPQEFSFAKEPIQKRSVYAADYHPSYFPEFRTISSAIENADWDMFCISGDVHWNRIIISTPRNLSQTFTNSAPNYRAKLIELVTSPAQRLATKRDNFLGAHGSPLYDPAIEIFTTAPWARWEDDFSRPKGPRVTASSYEMSTMGLVRYQPIGVNAARVDSAFCVKGQISTKLPVRIEDIHWANPGDWIVVNNSFLPLYRNYNPGPAINPDTVGDGYPYGWFSAENIAYLPPAPSSDQLVRTLAAGEQLRVEKVLFQAERTRAAATDPVQLEFQCVEVRDNNDELCFLWTIADSHEAAVPLRASRLNTHWALPGDTVTALFEDCSLFYSYEAGGNINHDNIRPGYPNGSYDHEAPVSPTALTIGFKRALTKGERVRVQEIVLQARRRLRSADSPPDIDTQIAKVTVVLPNGDLSTTEADLFLDIIANGVTKCLPKRRQIPNVRWCLPGEWIVVKRTPLELFRDFRIGDAATRGSIRPYYPNGSSDDYGNNAYLPPYTSGQQWVRNLDEGELLYVKRVLYQAARVHRRDVPRDELEYQCVEVATTRAGEDAETSQIGASFFVWVIYNGAEYTIRAPHHLFSATLRRRMPWVEDGDKVRVVKDGAKLWSEDLVQWPEGESLVGKRFEEGHIARAPFTGTAFRSVHSGEILHVQSVYFQAEQVYLASQDRYAGPYQVLKVRVTRDGNTQYGLYWSVYEGEIWAELEDWTAQDPRRREKEKEQKIEDEVAWLRTQAHLHTRTNDTRFLEKVLSTPGSVAEVFHLLHPAQAVYDYSLELSILWFWAYYGKARVVEFLGDVVTGAKLAQAEAEMTLEEAKFKSSTSSLKREIGNKSFSTLGGETLNLYPEDYRQDWIMILLTAIRKLKTGRLSDLVGPLGVMLGGTVERVTRQPETDLPSYSDTTNAIVSAPGLSVVPPFFVLQSDIQEADGKVAFEYWPDHQGMRGAVSHENNLSSLAFRDACKEFLRITPGATAEPRGAR